jgi:hypothetical protein
MATIGIGLATILRTSITRHSASKTSVVISLALTYNDFPNAKSLAAIPRSALRRTNTNSPTTAQGPRSSHENRTAIDLGSVVVLITTFVVYNE